MSVEDELAEHWDAAHLTVYGDLLVERGDPRGELIALDLIGGGAEVNARRTQLLVAWIGEDLVARLLAAGSIECGFVEVFVDGTGREANLLYELMNSPAAPFVRSLTLRGTGGWLATAIRNLAAKSLPWLHRLAIVQTAGVRSPPTIARTIADRLAAAMPRLTTLDVTGRRVFAHLEVPHLRTLRVTGADAILSLANDGAIQLPALATLDLAFVDGGPETESMPANLLPPAKFPALVSLDVSRCEPGLFGPTNLGGSVDLFQWLNRPIATQLVELRVPSVRTDGQAQQLEAVLARMPALQRIEQVRAYAARSVPFQAPATVRKVVGIPHVHLPPDEVAPHIYEIVVGEGDAPNIANARPLAVWLDANAARLPEHVRAAWRHVWTFVAQLRGDRMPFPAVVLETALASLTDGEGLAGWLRVGALLRRPRANLPALHVAIRRRQ